MGRNLNQMDLAQAEKSLMNALKDGNPVEISACYNSCGDACRKLGQYDRAINFHRKEVEHNRTRLAEEWETAFAMRFLGNALIAKGEVSQALDIWLQGLQILDRVKSTTTVAVEKICALFNVGLGYERLAAESESPGPCNVIEDVEDCISVDSLGGNNIKDRTDVELSHLASAERHWRRAVTLLQANPRDPDNRIPMIEIFDKLASLLAKRGIQFRSIALLEESASVYDQLIARSNGPPDERSRSLFDKARLLLRMGRHHHMDSLSALERILRLRCKRQTRSASLRLSAVIFLIQAEFSQCISALQQLVELEPGANTGIERRINAIRKIEAQYADDPKDGLPLICCEYGEFRAANQIYCDMLVEETDVNIRTDLWMDKAAVLEKWLTASSSAYELIECPPVDIKSAIISAYRFCIHELQDRPDLSTQRTQIMMEYAKFLAANSHFDVGAKVYNDILQHESDPRLHSLAVNALQRMQQMQANESGSSRSTSPQSTVTHERQLPKSDHDRNKADPVIDLTENGFSSDSPRSKRRDLPRDRVKTRKGQALVRKRQRSSPSSSASSSDSDSSGGSNAVVSVSPAHIQRSQLAVKGVKDAVHCSDQERDFISCLDLAGAQAQLTIEKRNGNRPAVLFVLSLHLATIMNELGRSTEAARYFSHAIEYCPQSIARFALVVIQWNVNDPRFYRNDLVL
uniref:Uncharacterized protein n=1 Tax=Spongospora subterranea TaxID=70186 RepID=A0A0H5QT58_9EUKA|eukprot:CRZ05135.1 hypothetical protein [Spongospora subterranea]